jgi:hypothetical protein
LFIFCIIFLRFHFTSLTVSNSILLCSHVVPMTYE